MQMVLVVNFSPNKIIYSFDRYRINLRGFCEDNFIVGFSSYDIIFCIQRTNILESLK